MEWNGATEGPIAPKGKLIYGIPCALAATGCARLIEGVKEAADYLGWTFKTGDPNGDPAKASALIQQATDAHADAIVLGAIEPKQIAGALANARKAGIIVVNTAGGRQYGTTNESYFSAPGVPKDPLGVQADVNFRGLDQGRALGAFMALNGDAKVVMFETPEYPTNVERANGVKEEIAKCSTCKILARTTFTTQELLTNLGAKTQSYLRSNPSANWLFMNYDNGATAAIAEMKQPGAKKVKVTSVNGDEANIKMVLDGEQAATVGTPLKWEGWEGVNEVIRLMNGQRALMLDDLVPYKLITKENAAQFPNGFEGDIDFRAKYKELWSTGKTDTSTVPLQQ